MNISKDFKDLYVRDLSKLREEINLYENEDDLWLTEGEIKNSGGNLALHLTGNLQHFVGHILSGTNYVRQRDFEFNGRVSKVELVEQVDTTIDVIKSFFDSASEESYTKDYPLEVFGHKMTCFYFLSHFLGHLNYHLGQVNYHRRILSK